MGTVLRIGDVEGRPEEACEVVVKTSKCTASARPKGWKKFARRGVAVDEDGDDEEAKVAYAQLTMRTEYFIDRSEHDEDDENETDKGKGKDQNAMDVDDEDDAKKRRKLRKSRKRTARARIQIRLHVRTLSRRSIPETIHQKGYRYLWVLQRFERTSPSPFFPFILTDTPRSSTATTPWARSNTYGQAPPPPPQQVALSSIAQAMAKKELMAIARWVSRDGADPKMGVLSPSLFENVDCLLWVQVSLLSHCHDTQYPPAQMPFADDVRKYTFASLDNLINKKGEAVSKHPYIPTDEQQEAMDKFVDAMDVMHAGEKDEEGCALFSAV